MDLESEVFNVRLKRDAVRIADWIGSDRRRFGQLMKLYLHGESRVAQQAAWILGICSDRHPWLVTPWLAKMVQRMQEHGVHDGVKRNAVRILQAAEIPRSLLGEVVTVCFEYLDSYDSPIAVKAFAMTVLTNAVEREPALAHELSSSLALHLQSPSPGVRAHARMMMERIAKLEQKPDRQRTRKKK